MAVIKKNNAYNPFGCDDGDYEAVVNEVKEKDSERFDKKPFLFWTFKIKDPVRDGKYIDDDVFVSGLTPSVAKEGQKLDSWLKALGINLADGDEFDTNDLIGRNVKVIVENTKQQKDGTIRCTVTKLIPIRIKPARPGTPEKKQTPLEKVREESGDSEIDPAAEAILAEVEQAQQKEAAVKNENPTKKETAVETKDDLLDFADDVNLDDVPF